MKRTILISMAMVLVIVLGVYASSCMDREPAPVCPVPTEIAENKFVASGFDGVDMLVVVDNSGSMEQEQQILSTGFFTLINSLANPITGTDWPYPEVENMRVAVVTSDLGLQYGPDRSTEGFPYNSEVPTCTDQDAKGDNGSFRTNMPGTVEIESDQIRCADDGAQCPDGWSCNGGLCSSPSGGAEAVNCKDLTSGNDWAETKGGSKNTDLAIQVACMGKLGTSGCGIEQQLEASVLALSRDSQEDFMVDSHLLAVLIVTDEEDCSVEDRGLFDTNEWKSKTLVKESDPNSGLLNTACNLPQGNEEDYLFETSRYWEKLIALKDGQARAVVFASIVGVPGGDDSPCQGRGNELADCLGDDDMALEVQIFEQAGTPYKHFAPACTRTENDVEVTSARPGRRYVKVAQSFGANGYVYSICNSDWSPAMKEIAKVIAENIGSQCYDDKLDWTPTGSCDCGKDSKCSCGVAKCDVVVTLEFPPTTSQEKRKCPSSFKVDPNKVQEEVEKDNMGRPKLYRLYCPMPKLDAPIDCGDAKRMYAGVETLGWYYCENQNENFEETCSDGIDNDGDDDVDCDDDGCKDCKVACDGTGVECENSCKYGVEMTTEAKDAARGYTVTIQCLGQFDFEDENCQENTQETCNDLEDNDGNGVFDCRSTTKTTSDAEGNSIPAHFADPNCCPMVKTKSGKCSVDWASTSQNCPGASKNKVPDSCFAAALKNSCSL